MIGFGAQKEKGAALALVMAATAAIMGITATITHIQQQMQQSVFREYAKGRQIEVGKKVAGSIVSPFILRATAEIDSLPGNRMLKRCLGLATGNSSPRMCDPSKEYPLLVSAGRGHLYQEKNNQYSNCGSQSIVSCYLAGAFNQSDPMASSRVHYGLDFSVSDGDVPQEARSHPFFAEVFFQPICNPSGEGEELTPQRECAFAELIKLRYKITHIKAGSCVAKGSKFKSARARDPACLPQFSPEPKGDSWLKIARTKIIGSLCNTGASLRGIDPEGNVECECHKPYYVPTGQVNNNGPLCEPEEVNQCPEEFIQLGRNSDGTAICKLPSLDANHWYKTLCASSSVSVVNEDGVPVDFCKVTVPLDTVAAEPRVSPTFLNNYPPYRDSRDKEVDCSTPPPDLAGTLSGGWVANISHFCTSTIGMLEAEGEKDPNFVYVVGAALGGLVVGLLIAYAVSAGAVGFILGPLFLAVLAALIIFIIFSDWDWHIPNTRPIINCEIQVRCESFRSR